MITIVLISPTEPKLTILLLMVSVIVTFLVGLKIVVIVFFVPKYKRLPF